MELITPPDDGCILNGVNRQTIIDMADKVEAQLGCKVVERQISIHELINSDKEDRLHSMFGVSTHCPLLPVNRVCYRDTTLLLDTQKGQDFNAALNQMLVDEMQAEPDNNPWITRME